MGSASRLTAERFVAEVMSGQRHWNKYGSYAELASFEVHGRDYRVRAIERRDSPVLIIAPHGGMIEILQGEDMGVPSRLRAEITSEPGASIRVSGAARQM